jgi:phosphotransferase family enzyme
VADARGQEVPLEGGNMTAVVRVGDTVRRAAGPWTPAVHALLRHIRAAGFRLGPEPLGIDERGREILTYVPGRAGGYPLAEFILSERTLTAVTSALRAYHDATAGFTAPAGAPWQWPDRDPVQVICHNDWAPYNLIFDGGDLTGVIDFDLASPGPRVWDMAYAAYRFVPLTAPENPDVPYPGAGDQARRLARFCAVYGDAAIGPRAVVDAAVERLRALNAFMHREAAAGNAAQQAIIDRGRGLIYEADAAYLERCGERLCA